MAVIAAAAATASYRVARDLRGAERALADALADPRPLHVRRQEEPIHLLFVHLGTLSATKELANARLQVRLRYGGDGVFQEKYSQKVKTSAPSDAGLVPGAIVEMSGLVSSPELNGVTAVCERWDAERQRWSVRTGTGGLKAVSEQNLTALGEVSAAFEAMCVFRWDPSLPPRLTLELLTLGFLDSVTSRITLGIPFSVDRPGVAEQEILFQRQPMASCCMPSLKPGKGSRGGGLPGRTDEDRLIGHMGLAAELRCFSARELMEGASDPLGLRELAMLLEMVAPEGRGERPVPPAGVPTVAPGLPVHGATPIVIGRPIPGTGWSWNGNQRVRT